MNKRLKDAFRARDDQGIEYEVKVYVDVTTSHTFGGPVETEGFATGEGRPLSGPFAGQTFRVTRVDDETYQISFVGPGPKLIRIR